MSSPPPARLPRLATRIARWLVRGPHARFVVRDLEELFARDLAAGTARGRALRRLAHNLAATSIALARARLRPPRLPAISALDARVGLRMMVKHPGLTFIGGLGIAVAIAVGAVAAASVRLVDLSLPFEEGDRIVAIETWDTEINNQERRILRDFLTWREELEAVEELGAYRLVSHNLIMADGAAEPVRVAEITASAFALTRVAPVLGRHLVTEDHRPGAPPVVVIGHDLWRGRLGGDAAALGQTLRLGGTGHTIVGVMPAGYRFPINDQLWVPLALEAAGLARLEGPRIFLFARLAPDVDLATAQAELDIAGRRLASAHPATHARLRPRVTGYTRQLFDDMEGWEIPALHVLVGLLLTVVCTNVAILVYARTATRGGEIAVRSALGASRPRLVGQLFIEALVLSASAALLGLGGAGLALDRLDRVVAYFPIVPFWIEFGLTASTIGYGLTLAFLAALIVTIPTLRSTGLGLQASLQRAGLGGPDARLGRTWTALVVMQVTITVAALPPALHFARQFIRFGHADPGASVEGILTASLRIPLDPAGGSSELAGELTRRIDAEPGVAGTTLASHVPGGEPRAWIEIEGVATPAHSGDGVRAGRGGHEIRSGRVAPDYFRTLGQPILAGRGLEAEDALATAASVIVNRAFVEELLGGASPLGARFRYIGRSGDIDPGELELERWYEVVGVVPDFPAATAPDRTQRRIYHGLATSNLQVARLLTRTRDADPIAMAARFRAIAARLDPELRLRDVLPLGEVLGQEQGGMRLAGLAILVVTLSVLLLASAGAYALMSFTVTQRRREIGIRSALGAGARRVVAGVLTRALLQLGGGAMAGGIVAALLLWQAEIRAAELVGLIAMVAVVLMIVGLAACLVPVLRGLHVEPTEALRVE